MTSPRKSPAKKRSNPWVTYFVKWRKSHPQVTANAMKKAAVDYHKSHKKSPKKKSPKRSPKKKSPKKKSASRRK